MRAGVLIGSRARRDHPADEFSDLDIIVVARDPQPYLVNADWLVQIGQPWVTFLERAGGGQGGESWERRVLFAGGLDVDFAFELLANIRDVVKHGPPPDMVDVFQRGYRLLFDKDHLLEQMKPDLWMSASVQPNSPDEKDFLNLVSDFWYHVPWTAKHLRRGELWWAKGCCDGYLKELLRRMMEWHARGRNPQADTWMRGRFLEEWADPRAVQALEQAFAHYEVEDVWQALFATAELFHWISQEAAHLFGYPYPEDGANHALALASRLYDQR